MKNTTNKINDYYLCYHVLCIIDILGQKEKLGKWPIIINSDEISDSLIKSLKSTAGVVLGFKNIFNNYFNEAQKITMPDRYDALSPEQKELHLRFRDCNLKCQRFSDTFVFYSPILNKHNDASVISVHQIIGACCMAMITSLAAKIPIRGSIAIGPGIELEDNYFYGPPLAEAHHLESKIAGYPRIVVSNSVLDFLSGHVVYSNNSMINQKMCAISKRCRSYLYKDTDGKYIIDYLGPQSKKDNGNIQKIIDCIKNGYEFVISEYDRFLSSGNKKLAERYLKLKDYMGKRIPLWEK